MQSLIWAIVFIVWVRTGPFLGILALWVHSIADMTKLFSEHVERIETGGGEKTEKFTI